MASGLVRIRIIAATIVLLVIPVGLFARSHRAGADPSTITGFLSTYTGDTLWPVMFYFIGRFVFPFARRWRLLVFILALTLSIEFVQLVQTPALQWLRRQSVIGFILGDSFVWSDVWCILVGALSASLADLVLIASKSDARLASPTDSSDQRA